MRNTAGHRDLSLIRQSGSTARVLDLARVADRPATPDIPDEPIFRSKRLNRSIILKHALRVNESQFFSTPHLVATKILAPYAARDLSLGGESFFVGQRGFEPAVRDIGGYANTADFEADLEVLYLLQSLPSLDPFLTRECLRSIERNPSRNYFQIAPNDLDRMRGFVAGELQTLLKGAFGEAVGADYAKPLADKLITDETARALDPLRVALQMSGEDYREGVFAWKGFLYYKWRIVGLQEELSTLKASISSMRLLNPAAGDVAQLAHVRSSVCAALDDAYVHTVEALLRYDQAFASLSAGDAGAFRSFLIGAPAHFVHLGRAAGVIQHIQSYWAFRFPNRSAVLDFNEADMVLRDFNETLGQVSKKAA